MYYCNNIILTTHLTISSSDITVHNVHRSINDQTKIQHNAAEDSAIGLKSHRSSCFCMFVFVFKLNPIVPSRHKRQI